MQLGQNKPIEKGYSLIEVLVALAISSFLLLGLSQVFIQSNQSYFVLDGSTEVQENARFSLAFIKQSLQKSGYRPLPASATTIPDHVQLYTVGGEFTVAGQFVFGKSGDAAPAATFAGNTAKADTDIVIMRGIGDMHLETHDCVGNVIPYNTVYTLTFYVDENDVLICDVDNVVQHEMVESIATLQILYGVNTCPGGAAPCLQYLDAAQITGGGGAWNEVLSVKIGLLAMSTNTVFPDLDAAPKNVLDGTYTLPVADQRRATQLYTDTILLRNK